MAIIQLKNLRKRFGPLVVLDGIDLDIHAGQTTVIIGASGTGKSVLLKHIVGLLKPDAGEVWFEGRRIDPLGERALMRVRTKFGFLFQSAALFDSLTVAENIAFPLRQHTSMTNAEIAGVVEQKLGMIGLPGIGSKMPAELSGGQRKRVGLARAIALDPDVICYDEPTTGLDPIRSDVINELILKLKRELNVTSVVVTHDMASVFKVADRVVMLAGGRIAFDGTADELRDSTDPQVRRFVLGQADESELAGLKD